MFARLMLLLLLAVGCGVMPPAVEEVTAMERVAISADGTSFVLASSGTVFRVHGFNYDHDAAGALLESYWDERWEEVVGDFEEMRALGANVVRIHLQVSAFLESPTRANPQALARLADLLRLAERNSLRLDLTGLACYHKAEVPAWYDALDEAARWRAQAVFWDAVAAVGAESPAVFCYDLMNEPVLPGGDVRQESWLAGDFHGKTFVQYLALSLDGRTRIEVATAWAAQMSAAIRARDSRALVTVGVIPWGLTFKGAQPLFYSDGPRAHLDFAAVHVYPRRGEADLAADVLRTFDLGMPVIIEEIFPLKGDLGDIDDFLARTADFQDGIISFYWGQTPAELGRPGATLAEAITRSWLLWFRDSAPLVE